MMNSPDRESIVAVYSGSFDPIHNGHLAVAGYISSLPWVRKVMLSVSPRNPLKSGSGISPDVFRIEMAKAAVDNYPGIEVTDVEMTLPSPSYSIHFLDRLKELCPDCRFALVIGADNWLAFDKWYKPQEILSRHGVIVCPRPGYPVPVPSSLFQEEYELGEGAVYLPRAPLVEVSSTEIRRRIAAGESVGDLVPREVELIIREENLWR